MLSKLRNFSFWRLDFFSGSRVKKAYDEIALFDRVESNSSLVTETNKKKNK